MDEQGGEGHIHVKRREAAMRNSDFVEGGRPKVRVCIPRCALREPALMTEVKNLKPQKPRVNAGVEMRGPAVFIDGVEERDEYFLATGVHARRVSADLDELRGLRLKRTGGAVFPRKGTRFLQIKYPDGKGGWRYESARAEPPRR
jgi:hypothetical protein